MREVVTVVGDTGLATKKTFRKRGEAEAHFNNARHWKHVTFVQWVWFDGSVWGFSPGHDTTVRRLRDRPEE